MVQKWIVAVGALAMSAGAGISADKAVLVEEAKILMQEFGGALKAELMAGVEAGGPVNAIGICNTRAPEIAAAVSTDGWIVGRSSHKLRNPDNAADPFTAAAIEDFLARQVAGEDVNTFVAADIVEENGQQVFRLVKAIPTGDLCLNCHGSNEMKPEVEAKLSELYPNDQARGFSAGEMRGVFTLSKVLSE